MRKLIVFILILFAIIAGCNKKSPTIPQDTPDNPALYTATATCSLTAEGTSTISPTFTETPTITITATSTITPTVTCTVTPKLFDHFTIKGPGGIPLNDCVAGVPFTISITAWADAEETLIAKTFDGFLVNFYISNSYSDYEYCIEPTISGIFTQGWLSSNITLYRSSDSEEYVTVKYGNHESSSDTFQIIHGPVNGLMVLPEGTVHKPGLKHLFISGYQGYEGYPDTQEAGLPFDMDILFVDSQYNKVTSVAEFYSTIFIDDLSSTIDGVNAFTGVHVTATAGFYHSSNVVLTDAGDHIITAQHNGSLPSCSSPFIRTKHTTADHFILKMPEENMTAGAYKYVTLVAVDAYGNTCDNRYTGVPFNNTADISVYYGSITISADYYSVDNTICENGLIYPMFTFGLTGIDFTASASSSGISGISLPFSVNRGQYFKTLIKGQGQFHDPGNMVTGGVTGSPAPASINNGYNTILYATDWYGNIDSEVNTYFMITSTDPLANVNGNALPYYVTITAGTSPLQITFRTAGIQTLYASDINQFMTSGDMTLNVQ